MATGVSFDFARKRFFIRPLAVTTNQVYVSGVASGLISRAVIAPFDVIQTLAQVGSKEGRKSYGEIVDDLMSKEGVGAFFRGNLIGSIRFFGSGAIHVLAFAGINSVLRDKTTGTITLEQAMLASSASSLIASALTYPLETIKTRLILDVDHRKYNGFLDCFNTTLQEEGWGALFAGVLPYMIANLLIDDVMDRLWAVPRAVNDATDFVNTVVAGIIAQTIYYPIDTCIKMVQAPTIYKRMRPDVEFDNTLEAGMNTVSKHGLFSLWRGYPIAVLKVIPGVLSAVLSYEGAKRVFEQFNNAKAHHV